MRARSSIARSGSRLALVLGAALAPLLATAAPAPALAARLAELRRAIGEDPRAAEAALAAQRAEAVQAGRADWRAAVDEIDCRRLAELDPPAALRVAGAGVAAARSAGLPEADPALLRLRACHGAMQLQMGQESGRAEIDGVLARAQGPALAHPRGLALLERGVDHSRAARYDEAQRDLLAACPLLQPWGPDHELCQAHLALHYRRIGDYDEALRLLGRLRDDARQRGAGFDEGVYVQVTAQVRLLAGDPVRALQDFDLAHQFALRAGDDAGAVFATAGAARALRSTGRAAEALHRLEPLVARLRDTADRALWLHVALVQAQALASAGRPQAAVDRLLEIESEMRAWKDRGLVADFLLAKASTMRALGRLREAWTALDEWRALDGQVQSQRLSVQSARLRLQYHRERDAQDLQALRRLNEQGAELRRVQVVAIGLSLSLLMVALAWVGHRLRQGRRLQHLASTDALTGLPNRRAVLAFLDQALARAQRDALPLAVLMIDIDRFKALNDRHGHAAGDEVLRHLGRVLPAALRAQDRLGRLGGEEFLAVLPDATGAQAVAVGERMREALAAAAPPGADGALCYTVSLGVAQRRDGDRASELLSRADLALYRAKAGGRNRVAGVAGEPA